MMGVDKTSPPAPAGMPQAEPKATPDAAAPSLEELYSDPETLKRIGTVIATAMRRGTSAKY
jgi:hypothetical protein